MPLGWAATQNNLGTALRTLAERESGTARLEQAVRAYRAALEEITQDRVPLDWAMTQNNLGIAHATLGERESGTARLEQAMAAWNACLTVVEGAWPAERVWYGTRPPRRDAGGNRPTAFRLTGCEPVSVPILARLVLTEMTGSGAGHDGR